MTRVNIYRDIQASLIRFCRDFGDQHGLQFVNLDAHTDAQNWPEADFLGMGELKVDITETDEVLVTFGISTRDDAYLLKMSEKVNHLVNALLPGTNLDILDAQTGEVKSIMTVARGVRIDTPMQTETQPLQPVMVRLLSHHRNA